MSRPSLATANIARAEANAERAAVLAQLAIGNTTVSEIIARACLPDGKALLRLPLARMLASQSGWTKRKARTVVRSTLFVLGKREGTNEEVDRLTLMWLVDARAGGRRVRAFADALDPKSSPPWPGFPYAAPQRSADSKLAQDRKG
jgi:hypothetical protein